MAAASRSQELKLQTGKKKKYIILAIVLIAIVIATVVVVIAKNKSVYKPPEFDDSAKSGIPTVEDSFMYKPITSDFGYTFSMAANIYQQQDASVCVFFTNPSGTDAYLMMEISEKDTDKVLYRSGLVKPGDYVERLKPQCDFENKAMEVDVKIYAFEPQTWYSLGTTNVGLTLQPW